LHRRGNLEIVPPVTFAGEGLINQAPTYPRYYLKEKGGKGNE